MLDVGCARGHICDAFRRAGWSVLGLDYSEVAIEAARIAFPECQFVHMDGTRPQLERRFDLILVRGFSACNTLDMPTLARLCNRYIEFLRPAGVFVLGHSTDFSGKHRAGDTACWDRRQINELLGRLDGRLIHTAYVPNLSLIKRAKLGLGRLLGWRNKIYFYLFIQKADSALKTD